MTKIRTVTTIVDIKDNATDAEVIAFLRAEYAKDTANRSEVEFNFNTGDIVKGHVGRLRETDLETIGLVHAFDRSNGAVSLWYLDDTGDVRITKTDGRKLTLVEAA